MKTLSEIKDEIGVREGYDNWEQYTTDLIMQGEDTGGYEDEIAIAYATEALNEAANRAQIKVEQRLRFPDSKLKQTVKDFSVNKQSILNLINTLK